METDSLGKVLPRILFPYVQQWAERSGFTLLSRLLVDEQFRGLIEKYGDEMMTQASYTAANGNGRGNGKRTVPRPDPRVSETEADANACDMKNLQDRVLAMEAQQEAQQALFDALRAKIRPLALALGCCPECLVGVQGCPKCWGRSEVAHYPPDYKLLEAQVVLPLAARGVPVVLNERKVSGADQSRKSTATRNRKSTPTRKRNRPWPKK